MVKSNRRHVGTMEGEEAPSTPNDGEKPFFAITSEDVARASEASESISVENPSPGEVEDEPSTTSAPANPWGAPMLEKESVKTSAGSSTRRTKDGTSPQSMTSNDDDKALTLGFFLGLFLPLIIVGGCMTFALSGYTPTDDDDETRFAYRENVPHQGDNQTFEFKVPNPGDGYMVDYIWCLFINPDDEMDWYVFLDGYGEYGEPNSMLQEQAEQHQEGQEDGPSEEPPKAIGKYYPSNNTVFFKLDGATAGEMNYIEFIFVPEIDEETNSNEETNSIGLGSVLLLLAGLGAVYFVSIVVAYHTEAENLLWGLCIAYPVGLATIPPMLAFFVI